MRECTRLSKELLALGVSKDVPTLMKMNPSERKVLLEEAMKKAAEGIYLLMFLLSLLSFLAVIIMLIIYY